MHTAASDGHIQSQYNPPNPQHSSCTQGLCFGPPLIVHFSCALDLQAAATPLYRYRHSYKFSGSRVSCVVCESRARRGVRWLNLEGKPHPLCLPDIISGAPVSQHRKLQYSSNSATFNFSTVSPFLLLNRLSTKK